MEIPEELRKKITFYPVKHMDEVIELTLGNISPTKTSAPGQKAAKKAPDRKTGAKAAKEE